MRKAKALPKEKMVQVSGYTYDWWSYPPEWDLQMKKLHEEADKIK